MSLQTLLARKQHLNEMIAKRRPSVHEYVVRLEEVERMIAEQQVEANMAFVNEPDSILTELERHLSVARQYKENGCPIDFVPIETNSADVNAMLEQLHKLQVREWSGRKKFDIQDQIGAWIRNFIGLLTDDGYAQFKAEQEKERSQWVKDWEAGVKPFLIGVGKPPTEEQIEEYRLNKGVSTWRMSLQHERACDYLLWKRNS